MFARSGVGSAAVRKVSKSAMGRPALCWTTMKSAVLKTRENATAKVTPSLSGVASCTAFRPME
eukprot:6202107-Pleurochrysis_carterae.AAC.1